MVLNALTISLIITAIYATMQEGMIFYKFRLLLERLPKVLHSPLFDCLTCMGGLYTVLIYPFLYGFKIEIIPTMFIVIGINYLIAKFLDL